jgi:hypothetical protein
MVRKAFVVGVLIFVSAGAARAQAIKHDIYGFEPGMTMVQVQAAAAKRGCALTPESERRYSCTRDDDPTTLHIMFGQRSGTVTGLALHFRNSFPVEKVKLDICKQYFADCSRMDMTRKSLDTDGDLVLQLATPNDEDNLFVVTINSQRAIAENAELRGSVAEKPTSDGSPPVIKRKRARTRLASHANKRASLPAGTESTSLLSRLGVQKLLDKVRGVSPFGDGKKRSGQ